MKNITSPAALDFCFQAILNYTKLDGERAQHCFVETTEEAALSRLNKAVEKAQVAGHDMKVEISVVAPIPPKRMTRAELISERKAEAYFRRYSPNCGRALGYEF